MTASLIACHAVSKADILNCLEFIPMSTLESNFSIDSFTFPPWISILQLFGDKKTIPSRKEEHQSSREQRSGQALALE